MCFVVFVNLGAFCLSGGGGTIEAPAAAFTQLQLSGETGESV